MAGAVDDMAKLETLLHVAFVPQEIPHDLVGERRVQERLQLGGKPLIDILRHRRLAAHGMHPAGLVRHHRDLLVLQRAPGLRRQRGAIAPHLLRHQPPVVRQDPLLQVHVVLRVQGRGHQVDVLERDPHHHEQRRRIQRRQRDAFPGAGRVAGLVAKGVHRLDRLGLPVGDRVGRVFIQAEMGPDIQVEVVFVALIPEQGIGLADDLLVQERAEPGDFTLLRRQPPRVEVEVEGVVVHDVLPEAGDPAIGLHLGQPREPGVLAPCPDARRHQVGQQERDHQLGKDEDFHVRQRHRRRPHFQFTRGVHWGRMMKHRRPPCQ